MAKTAFHGVKSAVVADLTNEDTHTYGTPIPMPGMVSVSADSETSDDAIYADDGPWVEEGQDNGVTGEIHVRDPWTDTTLRTFIAEHIGWTVDDNGNVERVTNGEKKPLAFGCEQGGKGAGAKRWWYYVQFGKPSIELSTDEDSKQWVDYTIPYTARPMKVGTNETTGEDIYSAGKTAFKTDANYATFLNTVPVTPLPAPTQTQGQTQGQ